jgi:hypothetical protein
MPVFYHDIEIYPEGQRQAPGIREPMSIKMKKHGHEYLSVPSNELRSTCNEEHLKRGRLSYTSSQARALELRLYMAESLDACFRRHDTISAFPA